jgi:hypothetical protein
VYGKAVGTSSINYAGYFDGDVEVVGETKMTAFEMPTGASSGHVLTSDGSGVGTWQAPTGAPDNDWVISGDDVYKETGNVGIGTTSPSDKLEIEGSGDHGMRIASDYRARVSLEQTDGGSVFDDWSLENVDGDLWFYHRNEDTGTGFGTIVLDHSPPKARMGVGNGSPEAKLHVTVGDTSERGLKVDGGWDFTGAGGLDLVTFQVDEPMVSDTDLLDIYAGDETSATDAQYIECRQWEGSADNVEFRVDLNLGNAYTDGAFTTGGADVAEMVVAGTGAASLEPGDVLVIDTSRGRSIVASSQPRSTLVAGVYSTKPGVVCSDREWDEASPSQDERVLHDLASRAARFDEVPVAVLGIVPCKVSAENGPIEIGDLLVTSGTPRYAMKDDAPRPGTILGKAMGSLESGTGVIDILVTLQ